MVKDLLPSGLDAKKTTPARKVVLFQGFSLFLSEAAIAIRIEVGLHSARVTKEMTRQVHQTLNLHRNFLQQ